MASDFDGVKEIKLARLNLDELDDLLVEEAQDGRHLGRHLHAFVGNGAGRFFAFEDLSINFLSDFHSSDIDNDGLDDLVISSRDPQLFGTQVRVFRNVLPGFSEQLADRRV